MYTSDRRADTTSKPARPATSPSPRGGARPNPNWSKLATGTAQLQRAPDRGEIYDRFLAAREARDRFVEGAPYFLHNHLPSTGRGFFDAMYYPPDFRINIKVRFNFARPMLSSYLEGKGYKEKDVTWAESEKEPFRQRFFKEALAPWNAAAVPLYCTRPYWDLQARVRMRFYDVDRDNPAGLPLAPGEIKPHFDVLAFKVPQGESQQDLVVSPNRRDQEGRVNIDSESLTPTRKDSGFSQRGAVHEAGHMLGLDDVYTGTGVVGHEKLAQRELGQSVPVGDDGRIMSTGETIGKTDTVTFVEAIRKATRMPEWSLSPPPLMPSPMPPTPYDDGVAPREAMA